MASTDSNADFDELVKRLPATADVLALRVAALAEQGEEERAEAILRRAISRHAATSLRITLARVLLRREAHKEAMAEMVAVLRSEPDNPNALLVLTSCLIECGELERGGKMLRKAHAAGAQPMEVKQLEDRWHELVGRSTNPGFANLSLDTLGGANRPGTTRPKQETDHLARKRQSTLMGSPNPAFDVGDPKGKTSGKASDEAGETRPRRLPPPPLQSGSFANLDTYDIDGDADDELDSTLGADSVRASELHSEYAADPTDLETQSDDVAAPSDPTYAMKIPDDEIASPDEQTAYIVVEEDDGPTTRSEDDLMTVDGQGSSIQYDAGFAAEARRHAGSSDRRPPADLDDLPAYQSNLPRFDSPHVEEDPTAPDFPPTREEQLDEYVSPKPDRSHNLPGLDPSVLFDDEFDDPSRPRPGHQNGGGPQPPPSPRSPHRGSGPNRGSGQMPPSRNQHPQQPSAQRRQQPAQPPQQPAQPRQQPAQRRNEEPLVRVHEQPGPRPRPGQQRRSQDPRPAAQPRQQGPEASLFELEGNSVPLDERWRPDQSSPPRREDTAVAAEPKERRSGASTSIRMLVEKRWPVAIVILLALLVGAFLSLIVASGMTLNSKIEGSLRSATDHRAPDTYNGYLDAERELIAATKTNSFMGPQFDTFVEQTIPIPGLSGTRLRKTAIAELAVVSGILEHRFTSRGEHSAAERTETAEERAPNETMTPVARAYVELISDRPHRAVTVLEEAATRFPGDFRIDEARAWALLAADRVAEADKAVQPLRAAPDLSVYQKFLVATVTAARGDDATAAGAFAEVFAESEEHVDSRLARSYTLRGGEGDFQKAEKVLNSVFELTRKTSRFQKARAVNARGSLYLAQGEKDSAEERFRDAISKMPTRSEVYLPLIEFYLREGRREDAEQTISKAREEDAYSPRIALYEAKIRMLDSDPQKAIEIVQAIESQDVRTAYLHGLALLDLHRPETAAQILEAGQDLPGDPLHVRALFFVARALEKDESVEDSVYQLERIKSKNGDDATVHWAAALSQIRGAQVTTSKGKRTARLKQARKDIERAIELNPDDARMHLALCEIRTRELAMEKADAACVRGRALAPDFVPGMVATARLHLVQGEFEKAGELADRASELRSDDPVVGLLRARVAIEQRRLEEARDEINRWLGKKSVDKHELSLLEGRLEFTRENYTRAAGYLKEAFEMQPDAGEGATYYAHTLARLGQYDQAGEILLEYLDHPTWGGYAWATLGEVRRKQRRFKDAFENLNKARKLYSKQVVPGRYLSHLYSQWALTYKDRFRKWRHKRVYQMLKRGREQGDPDDPELNMTFGMYHLEKRRPDVDAAMRSLEKVVEHAPFRCDAVEALKRLYEKDEDEDELEKIQEVYDDNCAPDEEQSGDE